MIHSYLRYCTIFKIIWMLIIFQACADSHHSANEAKTANADPFIKTWSYSDGIKNHQLIIAPSQDPSQDYRISYEGFLTDECKKTSNNTIDCLQGTRFSQHIDLAQDGFSIKLNNTEVFYAPEHEPVSTDNISGVWTASMIMGNTTYALTITIFKSQDGENYSVMSSLSGENSKCLDPKENYSALKNADQTILFTNKFAHTYERHEFIYDARDPNNIHLRSIEKPNSSNPYSKYDNMTKCINVPSNIIFKKN